MQRALLRPSSRLRSSLHSHYQASYLYSPPLNSSTPLPSNSPTSIRLASTSPSPSSPPAPPPSPPSTSSQKRAGDISDAFASLSNLPSTPLPASYALLKKRLISGHEEAIISSWTRLLEQLRRDVERVRSVGSGVVPEIGFGDLVKGEGKGLGVENFGERWMETGVAVVRGVVQEEEARGWWRDIGEYVERNPGVKGMWSPF